MSLTHITYLFYSPVPYLTIQHPFAFKQHEDLGMMAQYNVTGMEGAHWTGAHDIDPNCTVKGEESSGQ